MSVQLDESTFANAFLHLLQTQSRQYHESYAGNTTRSPTILAKMPQEKLKKSKDSQSKQLSLQKITVSLKSLKPPKMNRVEEVEVSENTTALELKDMVLLQGARFLVKGKVVKDSAKVLELTEDGKLTIIVVPAVVESSQSEDSTVNTNASTSISSDSKISPQLWAKLKQVLIDELGADSGSNEFAKLKSGYMQQ